MAPTGGEAANMANVKLRAFPGGVIVMSKATAFGIRIPPPIPVNARIVTKEVYVAQNAFPSENSTRMLPAIMSMF